MFLLGRLIEWGQRNQIVAPFTANTAYVNTIPAERQPPYPGDRAIERRQELDPLERDGHGGSSEPPFRGDRRTHLHLRVGGDAAGGRVRAFLPRQHAGTSRRSDLLPGAFVAGHLCTGVPAATAEDATARELPARAAAGRRTLLLSPPLADARFLGVSHGLDGAIADHGHLPSEVQSLSPGPRFEGHVRRA